MTMIDFKKLAKLNDRIRPWTLLELDIADIIRDQLLLTVQRGKRVSQVLPVIIKSQLDLLHAWLHTSTSKALR